MAQRGTTVAAEDPPNDRLLSLSDGVFAFAMTLLVLGLTVPNPRDVSPSQLPHAVASEWPSILTWVISFLVIGNFWLVHHRLFRYLRTHNERLAQLNLLLLLTIAFLPFPTSLMGQFSASRFAVIFYACSILITSLLMTLIGWYAQHRNFLHADTPEHASRERLARGLAVPTVGLVSIGLSFANLDAARLSWALIPVAFRLAERALALKPENSCKRGRRDH